jgi:hypothetical protein
MWSVGDELLEAKEACISITSIVLQQYTPSSYFGCNLIGIKHHDLPQSSIGWQRICPEDRSWQHAEFDKVDPRGPYWVYLRYSLIVRT